MTKIIVSDLTNKWEDLKDVSVISPAHYLENSYWHNPKFKIINLCSSYKNNSTGYLISAFAAANNQKVIPNLTSLTTVSLVNHWTFNGADHWQMLNNKVDLVTKDINIYFGLTQNINYTKIGIDIFYHFNYPILKLKLNQKGLPDKIELMDILSIDQEQERFFKQALRLYLIGKNIGKKKFSIMNYDLAVLADNNSNDLPSDAGAIQKLFKSAEGKGFNTEIIGYNDLGKVSQFDVLFFRTGNHSFMKSYQSAIKAENEGVIVLNTAKSMLKCHQKPFLINQMKKYFHVLDFKVIFPSLKKSLPAGFPVIVKKLNNPEYQQILNNSEEYDANINAETEILYYQQLIKNTNKWSLGIFDGVILYASVTFHSESKQYVKPDQLPEELLQVGVIVKELIGNGFYQALFTEHKQKFYFQDLNDNPPLFSGSEDSVNELDIYDTITDYFLNQLKH